VTNIQLTNHAVCSTQLSQVKTTHTHKPTGLGSPVRTAHMTVYSCAIQYSKQQFQ